MKDIKKYRENQKKPILLIKWLYLELKKRFCHKSDKIA